MKFLLALAAFLLLVPACEQSCDLAEKNLPLNPSQEKVQYVLAVFAYQSRRNRIHFSHTFATAARIKNGKMELNTISWLPETLNVRVTHGPEKGVNLTLEQTIDLAQRQGLTIYQYGPYEIDETLYRRFLERVKELESGNILYKANDGNTRPYAVNCIHAVSDIQGMLNTGAKHGEPATREVVYHLGLHHRPIVKAKLVH